ncbi:MAG: LiaF domain-containing protein [Actinomycetota bacterium]|nr:cell wall-active antibiotics response protein [Actinomycetota bacterium]
MIQDPLSQSADPAITSRHRSIGVGQIVAGAIMMMIGLSWLIEAAGWADVPWRGILAGALIVVGVALMLGAHRGAHGGLIAFGIVLAVLLSLSSAIMVLADIPLTGGIGEQRHHPAATVEDEYRWGVGSMTLDLRGAIADLDGRIIEASVAIGELIVYVPEGIPIRIEAHTGIGETRVFGEADGGFDSDIETAGPEGALILRLDVAIGKVEVRR